MAQILASWLLPLRSYERLKFLVVTTFTMRVHLNERQVSELLIGRCYEAKICAILLLLRFPFR